MIQGTRRDPLGDGKSYFLVVDFMGSDDRPVDAARVSFAKRAKEFPAERNQKLARFLAKAGHETPFHHPQICVEMRMPIFVARQWFRHVVGIARNEESRRYITTPPQYWQPRHFRFRAENIKQGSSEHPLRSWRALLAHGLFRGAVVAADLAYKGLLKLGACPEQARCVLPVATYTTVMETMSLSAAARICRLRLDPHAQIEIQAFAAALHAACEEIWPVSFPALLAATADKADAA